MFIKIGDIYINQDHIESIEVDDSSIDFFSANLDEDKQPMYSFTGGEYDAVLNWLKYKAGVSKVC